MNNYIGEAITHKAFGKGTIKNIEGDKVVLDFNGTEKTFKFPDAFETFIKLDDAGKQTEVTALVEEKKKQKSEEAAKLAKEREEQMLQAQQAKKDKRNTRVIPHKEILIKGDTFTTHKDALNECFGFQYEHFQPAFKVVDDKFSVWFPSIARRVQGEYVSTETSNGWINVLSENDTVITEKNEDGTKNTERDPKYDLDRYVFAKFDGENYRFIGVYRPEHADRPWETGYKYKLVGTKVNLRTMEIL